MSMGKPKTVLIIGFTNVLFALYFLIVGTKMSALYAEFNVTQKPHPVWNNLYFQIFFFLTILSFISWFLLKRQLNKGKEINKFVYGVLLLLLLGPALYLIAELIYFLILTPSFFHSG